MTHASVPTLSEELNRKTFETVDWLCHAHDAGSISDAQFSTGMDAVWMVASGLVDNSFVDIVTETSRITRGITHRLRRHFINGSIVVSVSWTAGEYRWEYRQRVHGADKDSGVKEAVNPRAAREQMEKFCQKLRAAGYEEL
jgi:hypothetical protein